MINISVIPLALFYLGVLFCYRLHPNASTYFVQVRFRYPQNVYVACHAGRRVDRLRLRTLDETRLPVITINHWAAVVSRCWVKASACRLQVSLYCAVLYHIVLLSICPGRFSTALLASIVVWSPCGDTQCPSFVFGAVGMPCP